MATMLDLNIAGRTYQVACREGEEENLRAAARLVDGKKYQIALMLRATPLSALEDLGKTGEVMPQKSTYFFPKLTSGLLFHPLD